jgi:hypothetical protein
MKKSAMLVASFVAASAFAGDALALDTRAGAYGDDSVPITTQTAFGNQLVGFSDTIVGLGPVGQNCAYGMIWADPNSFLGGASQPCVLLESLVPGGCGNAANANVAAAVTAAAATCGGYNAAGTVFPAGALTGVQLFLGADPNQAGTGALTGVAVYPGNKVLPITL